MPYHFNPVHSVRWRYRYAREKLKLQRQYESGWWFYHSLIGPGDLAFDIGANIGGRSGIFHSLGARVVSLEPVKGTYQQLLKRTKHCPGLVALNLGASDHEGKATIQVNPISAICSLEPDWIQKAQPLFPKHHWDGQEQIQLTTLDKLIGIYGQPSFIKVDVEGHEVPVLKGLSHAVKRLSFEYSPFRMEPAYQCLDRLEALGSYRYNLSVGEDFQLEFPEYVSRQKIEAALEAHQHDIHAGDIYAIRVG